MIKNKTIKIYILLYSALITFNTNAIVVSDPTSYSYYINQLKEAKNQILEAQKQLTEHKRLNASFDQYMKNLQTKFDFVGNVQKALNADLTAFDDYVRKLSAKDKKAFDFNRKYDLKDLRDVIDTNLDGIYIDPTNPDYKVEDVVKLRTIERQRLIKEGLIKTEEKLTQLGQRYKDINELANKSKNAQSSKEALDINNAILVEILAAIHSLTDIVATLGQAEMASKFVHYAKDKQQKELQKRKNAKLYSNSMTMREHLDACHEYKYKHGHTNTTIDGKDCPQKALIKKREEFKKNVPDYASQRGI